MLNKNYRLKKNKDFRTAYKKGKTFFSPSIVMYAFNSNSSNLRIGFTVSKKVGKAVVRNRVKRKMREICRLNLHKLKDGYDIIFVAKPSIITKSYQEISKDINRLLKISKVNKVE